MEAAVRRFGLLAASACAFLTGCPSFATLKTARALDPGQLQVTEATEVLAMTAPPNKGLAGVRPDVIIAGRYGVVKGLDVGFRVEPVAGFSGETTIQLSARQGRGPRDRPRCRLFPDARSVIPLRAEDDRRLSTEPLYTIWSATFPLLFGLNFGAGHQVVVAPRATWYFAQPGNAGAAQRPGGVQTLFGASLGVSLKTSHTLRVMPTRSTSPDRSAGPDTPMPHARLG